MKNLKVLLIVVLVIMALDYITAPDPLATFEESFALTIFAYLIKSYFETDPYTLAGSIEYLSLILWLFGSIFWNIYVLHSYNADSSAYVGPIVAFAVPAIVSALGITVAGAIIETARKFLHSF